MAKAKMKNKAAAVELKLTEAEARVLHDLLGYTAETPLDGVYWALRGLGLDDSGVEFEQTDSADDLWIKVKKEGESE